MSTGYFLATLLTATFIGIKFIIEASYILLLLALPAESPLLAFLVNFQKLFLSLSFALPILPFFFYYIAKKEKRDHGEAGDAPLIPPSDPRLWRRWPNLLIILLFLPYAIQTLGTELETLTRMVFPCDEKYRMMMAFFRPTGSTWDMVGAYISIGIVGPICEEFFFREFLLTGMLHKKGRAQLHAILLFQGVLFGISHLNQWQIPYAIPMGILFGYLRIWTGSLTVPVVVHSLNNIWAVVLLYHFSDVQYFTQEECQNLEHMPWYYLVSGTLLLLVSLIYLKNNSVFRKRGE